MGIKARYMKQTCVYWAPGNVESGGQAFDSYGQPLYVDPVEKDCRWENIAESYKSAMGTEEISKSVVFIDSVLPGGLLMLGDLDDITDSDDPRNNEGAWEINQVEDIPNRRATETFTWAYL